MGCWLVRIGRRPTPELHTPAEMRISGHFATIVLPPRCHERGYHAKQVTGGSNGQGSDARQGVRHSFTLWVPLREDQALSILASHPEK